MTNRKSYDREYYTKHKKEKLIYGKKYYQTHKEERKIKDKIYYETHKNERLSYQKMWSKTEKGIINMKRHLAKRRQNLGFRLISKNKIDEPIEYHHIDNNRVAAIPKDMHILYKSRDVEYHRFMVNQIVEQIYGGD